MKKILLFIAVLVLTFTLTGCIPTEESYCSEELCYTQSQVDSKIDSAIESAEYKIYIDMDVEMSKIEESIAAQAEVKERTYDITEVSIVSRNNNIYLVETLNLINSDQYILISYNQVFEVGDKTHVALYYDGDVRLWNELKEFEDE